MPPTEERICGATLDDQLRNVQATCRKEPGHYTPDHNDPHYDPRAAEHWNDATPGATPAAHA